MGVFEFARSRTVPRIAQAIAESSAFSIAGGGDTLAAIAKYGIEKQVGYISTGGGAFWRCWKARRCPRLRSCKTCRLRLLQNDSTTVRFCGAGCRYAG